jgi:hypothetical protein
VIALAVTAVMAVIVGRGLVAAIRGGDVALTGYLSAFGALIAGRALGL